MSLDLFSQLPECEMGYGIKVGIILQGTSEELVDVYRRGNVKDWEKLCKVPKSAATRVGKGSSEAEVIRRANEAGREGEMRICKCTRSGARIQY
jgi:hypothetical protein